MSNQLHAGGGKCSAGFTHSILRWCWCPGCSHAAVPWQGWLAAFRAPTASSDHRGSISHCQIHAEICCRAPMELAVPAVWNITCGNPTRISRDGDCLCCHRLDTWLGIFTQMWLKSKFSRKSERSIAVPLEFSFFSLYIHYNSLKSLSSAL